MLKGWKSYLVAIATVTVTAAYAAGFIDEETYKMLLALLGAGAVSTVAAKINRLQKDVDKVQ